MDIDFDKYAAYATEKTVQLLSIDSPSGFTDKATEFIVSQFSALGFSCVRSNKGSVLVTLCAGAGEKKNGVLFEAHTDTLGAMVTAVGSDGRLSVTKIGGLNAANTETENVKIYTRNGKCFEGTLQLKNASSHVNKDVATAERNFDSVEVVIDEPVNNAQDVAALGIRTGDFVCPEPRTRVTASGYIKSRYLDDKLSVGCLLAYAKYLSDFKISFSVPVYCLITVYEEVGHGGSSFIPADVKDAISVDMGCVGEQLNCTEQQVSVCAKDSGGPYDYNVTNRLIEAAELEKADYAVDVYPFYGSDVEATLRAGHDVRHGLIGPGVYASHGYERSHVNGVKNTIKVIKGYIELSDKEASR